MPQDLIDCWNQRKLKAVILRVVVFANDPPSVERRILLSFLLFYGLLVGKYTLICAMEIQKIQILSIPSQDLLYRPFPSFPGPLLQNKGTCSAFDIEIIFQSHANKTNFHKKGCAPSLILKMRVFGTRKWPTYGTVVSVTRSLTPLQVVDI